MLGDGKTAGPGASRLYSALGRSTVIRFGEPYRAEAFIEQMERASPDLQLDWFRQGVGQFVVVLSYADRDEFTRSANQLSRAGFPLQ